jgi:hypothetical protein
VNFHGGGQNMDGNVCPSGPASCNRPFRYSPIRVTDNQVADVGPLFYGMLLVSRLAPGTMLATDAKADGDVDVSAYALAAADGATDIVVLDKDATRGVHARIDVGAPVRAAEAMVLAAPSLGATSGVTFGNAAVSPTGAWSPEPPRRLDGEGAIIDLRLAAGSAVLIHAR